ncbi:hypothetical protein EJ02DRAFT_476167 [Clathrospora elynae]|uniref:Dipeptidase domain-containing protein n=1 Tax=Clathrospora elynae TaxID=706981 RepID=A0A6A5SDI5_9PLEO|nr:hypothetical protein EJ02DRAFT_476167 [Clathrospora elynae]
MMFSQVSVIALLCFARTTSASCGFYIGKALTADGSVMLSRTSEEVSSHWLEIFSAKDHSNANMSVGVTEHASMPGRLMNISQASNTFRYLSMEYSDFEGFLAPLTNGGVNEKGIAVRDKWAQNRDDLIAMTPNPQMGLQYSDLARVVLERANTAREGVELIGQMSAEYGYANYGGNSHLIADANEVCIVWEMSGGKKLWAAERLGYIEDFPVDFTNSPDYMGSLNIVSFAIEQGWWNPNGTEPFNIFNVYAYQAEGYTARDGGAKYMSQAALENATRAMAPVTEKDLIERLWPSSVTAPFNPWWLGVKGIPPEYGLHRYLYKNAASTFLDPEYQYQEATYFAGRTFKQVLYYTCSNPEAFLPIVQNILHGFENASFADLKWVERSAQTLAENGQREAALDLLTFYSHARAEKALALGKTMVDTLDAYTKLTGQFPMPSGSPINDPGLGTETVNCLVGWDPDLPADQQTPLKTFRRQTRARIR